MRSQPAQSAYVVPRLADARCLLLCVYVAAMLEVLYEMLSTLYYLKFVAAALYLCDK